MSTRATITVSDEHDKFHIYQHYDGYPNGEYGLVRHLALAPRLAWDLPRFEAMDFAAAVVAVLKDRGGSTYLTAKADNHLDREFHYDLRQTADGVSKAIQLVVSKPARRSGQSDRVLFKGDLYQAVQHFDAKIDTASRPRELQILGEIDATLWRACDEMRALCGDRPDPDTRRVFEEIEDAGRALITLREHLAKADPWSALKSVGDGKSGILAKLAVEAHDRFQR